MVLMPSSLGGGILSVVKNRAKTPTGDELISTMSRSSNVHVHISLNPIGIKSKFNLPQQSGNYLGGDLLEEELSQTKSGGGPN